MKLSEIYNDLANLYGDKNGEMVFTFSDKGSMHSYIDFYESYFQSKRDSVRLLEIGMMTGGSMHLWQRYFEQYQLVGLDLNTTWNQSRPFQSQIENDPNVTLMFGINSRQPAPVTLEPNSFDFIIDDGDHTVMAQMDTFAHYWPLTAPGGTYFVEDVIGPTQIEILYRFLDDYQQKNSQQFDINHYKGFKLNRADDQILAITRK